MRRSSCPELSLMCGGLRSGGDGESGMSEDGQTQVVSNGELAEYRVSRSMKMVEVESKG